MADAPLDVNYDLSKAKTVVPLIADGHLTRLRLANLTLDSTDKGKVMKFEWKTTEPVPSTEGEQIRPGDFGSTFFENVQLYAKADAKNPTWFLERIAKRVDGLLGTGDPGNKKNKPTRPSVDIRNPEQAVAALAPQLVGKEIVAKMKVKTGDYIGNEIQTVTFPGDISA